MVEPAVLITGCSRGLGLQLARHYSDCGKHVIGTARGASELQHPNYDHRTVDITDELSVRQLWQDVKTSGIAVSLLVNNAGVSRTRPALIETGRGFEEVVRVNSTGSFVMTREAIKHMRRNKFGRVVSMSSINVPLSSGGAISYNASKSALESMTRTFANEIPADEDITLNCLGISLVSNTGMLNSLSSAALEEKEKHLSRPGQLLVGEIAHTINFLASKNSSRITGQTIYFGGV